MANLGKRLTRSQFLLNNCNKDRQQITDVSHIATRSPHLHVILKDLNALFEITSIYLFQFFSQ